MHVKSILLYEDDAIDISDTFAVETLHPQDEFYKEIREIFDRYFSPVEAKITKLVDIIR